MAQLTTAQLVNLITETFDYILARTKELDQLIAKEPENSNNAYALRAGQYELLILGKKISDLKKSL